MAANGTADSATGNPDVFLEEMPEFPDGSRFVRIRPMTDFRKDPGEARILYTCRQAESRAGGDDVGDVGADEERVMKIKAQWPGPQGVMHEGPSSYTAAELKALQKFKDASLSGVPHLITWKRAVQGADGVHPEGYLIYIVMTKMPGQTLWNMGYWSTSKEERTEIQQAFIRKLNEVRALGIAPYDCALRNVLWDRASKRCSIVDFEHWNEAEGPVKDETAELQRWGLAQRPAPKTWIDEWARGAH